MEYVEALRAAEDAINSAELADDLRAAAFTAVVAHMLASTGQGERLPSQGTRDNGGGGELAALAEALSIPLDAAGALFDMSSGEPELNVPARRLPRNKAEATRDFAILITGARRILDLDSPTDVVRRALDRHGCLDASNFTQHLRSADEAFINYQSTSRTLVIRVPGQERASEIARRFAGLD